MWQTTTKSRELPHSVETLSHNSIALVQGLVTDLRCKTVLIFGTDNSFPIRLFDELVGAQLGGCGLVTFW